MAELQARSAKLQAGRRTPSGRCLRRWIRVVFARRLWFGVAILVLAACSLQLAAAPAAQALDTGLGFGTATGLSTQDIRVTVAKIIRAFIGILGLVALVIILYGGFLWMTSGGSEEKIEKGKQVLTNGAIGLAIIFLSLGITQFIISRLTQALGSGGTVTTAGGFVEDVFLTGALGAGPVESHFPPRSAADIPRNTRIFVTFREAIDPATLAANSNGNVDAGGQPIIGTTCEDVALCDNYKDLALPESIQVMRVGSNVDPTKLTPQARSAPAGSPEAIAFAAEAAKLTKVGVAIAPGGKTIILSPVQTEVVDGALRAKVGTTGFVERALLGNADAPSAYIVRLTGNIKKATRRADNTPEDLFTGAFREYSWDFSVSTILDLIPPQITSVVPFPDPGQDTAAAVVGVPDQPRNVIVQLNFNEAVDPTVTTGVLTAANIAAVPSAGFRHLAVTRASTASTRLPGSFVMSNQYRTVEFTTDSACGQNTCGGTVYCLPGNAVLLSYAEAARLEAGGPTGLPFSGVMDAAGNSLDGNGDAAAAGPGAPGARRFDRGGTTTENTGASDSVQWQFATNDTIDLTAPVIREVVHQLKDTGRAAYPGAIGASLTDVQNVALVAPVEVLFSKLMSGNVTSLIGLTEAAGCNPATGVGCLWFSTFAQHEDSPPPADVDSTIDATRATISHATFRDVETGFGLPPRYRVRVDSGVKDIYQNCMFTVVNQAADPPTELAPSARGPQGPAGGHRCVIAGSPPTETCTPPLP